MTLTELERLAREDIAACGETLQAEVRVKAEDLLNIISALKTARAALKQIAYPADTGVRNGRWPYQIAGDALATISSVWEGKKE